MYVTNRLLRPALFGGLILLLLLAPAAYAGDREPTAAELAEMILTGNDAEHALVTAWVEKADRATLRAVFAALRDMRGVPLAVRKTEPVVPPAARGHPPVLDSQQRMLNAQVRVIDIVPAQAEDVLGRFRQTATKTMYILTGAEVEDLLRSVEKSADATVISAPRILVQNGQKANVSILDQVSYIKDYDVEVGDDRTD